MNKHEESARLWMEYATDDLESAETLLAREPPKSSAAAFHCQQAAEKDLKGFLVFHGRERPDTHNLRNLLGLAAQIEEALANVHGAANGLMPYAVNVRYPGTGATANAEEAAAALRHARQVRAVVHDALPF